MKKFKLQLLAISAFILAASSLTGQSGALDPTFDSDGIRLENYGTSTNQINAFDVQTDGKILLAGYFGASTTSSFSVTRLFSDGTPDLSFGSQGLTEINFTGLPASATSIAQLPDGKILVAGSTRNYGSTANIQTDFAIARLMPDGSLDLGFGQSGQVVIDFEGGFNDDFFNKIFLLSSGKFVIGGYTFKSSTNECRSVIGQFSDVGSPDMSFGNNGWAVSPTFNPPDANPGASFGIGRMSDGRFLAAVVDDFGQKPIRLFRFLATGATDVTFGTSGEAQFDPNLIDQRIFDLKFQKDDKILLTGNTTDNYDILAIRLLTDGTPDPSFDSDGVVKFGTTEVDIAYQITDLPNGKILLSGIYGKMASVIKLNADGSLDGVGSTTYGVVAGNFNIWPLALFPESDGKILVGGRANNENGVSRFLSDLTLDSGFGIGGESHFSLANGNDVLRAVAIQPDGKIVAVGGSYSYTSNQAMVVARYLSNGQPDISFGISGKRSFFNFKNAEATDIALQPDGGIVVGGWASETNGGKVRQFAVAKLLPDGSLDPSFDTDGMVIQRMGTATEVSACNSISLGSDNKIWAGGQGPLGGFAMMRFLPDGSLDTDFGNGTGKMVTDFNNGGSYNSGEMGKIKVLADGRVLAIGQGSKMNTAFDSDLLLARYKADGSLDATFGNNGKIVVGAPSNQYGTSLATYSDGRFLVGGFEIGFSPYSLALTIQRMMPDGSVDNTFGTSGLLKLGGEAPDLYVAHAVELQADGKILVAGYAKNGAMLLRLMSDGQIDTGFGNNGFVQFNDNGGECGAVAIQPDHKIIVVGSDNGLHDADVILARLLPGQVISTASLNAPAFSINAEPNPTSDRTVLSYTLNEAGPVSVFIGDVQGRILENVFSKKLESKGVHQFEVDMNELRTGIYLLVVETMNGSAAIRVLKN